MFIRWKCLFETISRWFSVQSDILLNVLHVVIILLGACKIGWYDFDFCVLIIFKKLQRMFADVCKLTISYTSVLLHSHFYDVIWVTILYILRTPVALVQSICHSKPTKMLWVWIISVLQTSPRTLFLYKSINSTSYCRYLFIWEILNCAVTYTIDPVQIMFTWN